MNTLRGGLWLVALAALQFTVATADADRTALDGSSPDGPAAPAGPGAPEIQVTGPVPVTVESVLSYATTGATTQHTLVPAPPRLGGTGQVRLIVNGDYSAGNETANLVIEGTALGTVNGADCAPVGKSFAATTAQLDTWLSNGSVTATVSNTSQVNATQCLTNNHTVRLTYFGPDPTAPELTFDPMVFGTTTALPLEIRNTGTASLNVTSIASNSGAFVPLTTSLVVPAGTATVVTVSFTPGSSGPQTGTLSIASDDADEPLITVPLSGTGVPLQVSPSSIILQLSGSQAQNRVVTVTNPGPTAVIWTLSENPAASWLNASETSGSIAGLGSAVITVTLTAPLPAGEYVTDLVFQTVPPSPQDVTVHVQLFVVEPQIGASPPAFQVTHAFPQITNHTLTLSNTGIGSLFYSISESAPWLSFTGSYTGSLLPGASDNLFFFLDSGGLAGGVYTTTITFNSNDPDGPLTVPVQLTLVPASIGFLPPSLSATLDINQTTIRTLTLTNGGPGTLAFEAFESLSWIEVSPDFGFVPPGGLIQLSATFSSGTLPGGTYNGGITFTSNDPASPHVFPVQLNVLTASIGVSPPTLSATLEVNQTSNQTLTVSNGGPGTLTFSVAESATWLSVSPINGLLPSGNQIPITVTFNTSSKPPGVYNTQISVTSNDPDGAVLIPVTLTILGPVMGVTPSSLTTTLDIGEVDVRTLTVTNTGQGVLAFTASDNAPWLSLAPTSGNVSGGQQTGLTVTFDAAGLGPGTYNGSITLQDNIPASPNLTVPVTLIRPSGSISAVPDALDVTLFAEDSTTETVTVSNGGLGTLTVTFVLSGSSWLQVAPTSGVVPPGQSLDLDVTVSTAALAGGIYDSHFVIENDDPTDPLFSVPVHLTVLTEPPDIGVGETPYFTESVLSYNTAGAVTSHALTGGGTPAGGATIEVIAEGNYGSVSETAFVVAEGILLGVVGPSGQSCGVAQETFTLPPNQFDALVVDGTVQVVVDNEPDVGAVCPVNRHTVRLSYLPAVQALAFGAVATGTSAERTLVVRNDGALPLEIGSLATGGAPFSVAPATLTVPADTSAVVTVTFSPTSTDAFNGALTFLSNDPDELSYVVDLSGTGGVAPSIGIAPGGVSATLISGARGLEALTVSNTGGTDLEFSVAAEWVVAPPTPTAVFVNVDPWHGTVPAGGTLELDVHVTTIGLPPGAFSANLRFASNDPASPEVVVPATLTLVSAPHLQIPGTPVTLDSTIPYAEAGATTAHAFAASAVPVGGGSLTHIFDGNYQAPGRTATIDAEGTLLAPVGNLALDCTAVAGSRLLDASFVESLAASGTFAFEVTNSPAVQANCPTNQHRLRLGYTPELAAIDFGEVSLPIPASRAVLLRNTGTETLEVTSIATDDPQFTVSVASATIPAGASALVLVTVLPATEEPVSALLVIESDDPDRPLVELPLTVLGTCDDSDGDGLTACAGDCNDANPFCTIDCADADADGFCVTTDCDDTAPTCTTLCADLDGDGVAACEGDCNDTNPFCTTTCTDADHDGYCSATDCDDTKPHCTTDCTDADADGFCVTTDCNDMKPNCTTNCTDADADGYCVTTDCDDTVPSCTTDCTDGDGDGVDACAGDCNDASVHCTTDCTDADTDGFCVTTDCDDAKPNCTTNCTDADADGFCVTTDCDDAKPNCTTNCTDADADGFCVTTDCDDTKPNCTTNCTDVDADGFCVTTDCDDAKPNCTTNCTDADADGFCVTTDCDDTVPSCTTDCTDGDGDGVEVCAGDCDDANVHCTTDCTDVDADGFCVTTDCDDAKPNCTTNCTDVDADGFCVTTDCNDAKPNCTTNCTDADADGFCVTTDCNEANPNCTSDCTDADADGFCVSTDCDDTNPNCTTNCTDTDLDGFCVTTDCDDTSPSCTLDCTDADGDGVRACAGDCDDSELHCTTDCTDDDADGFCVTTDCNDTNPNCTTDCTDADVDSFCVTTDCDDASATCNLDCADADWDGFRACDGDCDDHNAAASPAGTEVCTDSADNDCDGLADDEDEPCAGLVADGLRFEAGEPESLSWNPAPDADHYALYRGSIPGTGFAPYDHLCRAAEVASSAAVDPSVPRPNEGYYYLVTGQRVVEPGSEDFSSLAGWTTNDPTPTAVLVTGPLGRASSGLSRPDSTAIPCGARLHVDPTVVAERPDGRSWATAYPSIGAAWSSGWYPNRGFELWVRGTAAGGSALQGTRPGAVFYGGFAGSESSSWERDPALHPTVLDGGGSPAVISTDGRSFVLDGLTLANAGRGLWATPAGSHLELQDVRLEQLGGWGVELRSFGSRLIVEDSTHDGSGSGAMFAYADSGRLEGRIRRNVFSAGATDAALRLEARTLAGSSEVALDIVGNRIEGGARGMRLGAVVQNVARQAVNSSFVASNLIYGTTEAGVRIEATGNFTTGTGSALAEARPLVVGNTFSDGAGAGVVSSATRSDTSANLLLHPVRAVPELWDNLVTFHVGPGIQESADNVSSGVVADPAAVVGNDLHGNGALYLNEGATSLTLAQVNALAGAFENYDADPGYVDRPARDYHLTYGSVLGVGSSMRYLVNTADPGFGFAWIGAVFDDSDWDLGHYGVGYDVTGDASGLIETPVPPGAASVFTRSSFEVEDLSGVLALTLGVDYDDGWVAWLNGVEVARSASMPPGPVDWNTTSAGHESSNGSIPTFEETDISLAGLPALVTGTNVLAIGVWNTGPASDDLVLVPRVTFNVELTVIDAGHLEAPRLAIEDLDGEPRVTDGDLDGLARPDGGADERQ